jgi:hypothetical protein
MEFGPIPHVDDRRLELLKESVKNRFQNTGATLQRAWFEESIALLLILGYKITPPDADPKKVN